MKKNSNYIATYITCNHRGELEAYDVYKRNHGDCTFRKTAKESVEIFLDKKANIIDSLEHGNMLQISSCNLGVRIQIGTVSKEFYTNVPTFQVSCEEIGDNVFKTLEKLDNKMGNMVYSNKQDYQKEKGEKYEQRFNISYFSRRNG